MGIFVFALVSMFIAEMGDKTQLIAIAFTARYKIRDIIIGILGAAILLNLMAVAVGGAISNLIPLSYVSLIAGISFLAFALWTLKGEDNDAEIEENEVAIRTRLPAFLLVGATFFIAEIGDKTQLFVISLSAANPSELMPIFAGASLGLIAGDVVGIVVGMALGKKLPERIMMMISYAIFAVFGFITIYNAIVEIIPQNYTLIYWPLIIVFILLSVFIFKKDK